MKKIIATVVCLGLIVVAGCQLFPPDRKANLIESIQTLDSYEMSLNDEIASTASLIDTGKSILKEQNLSDTEYDRVSKSVQKLEEHLAALKEAQINLENSLRQFNANLIDEQERADSPEIVAIKGGADIVEDVLPPPYGAYVSSGLVAIASIAGAFAKGKKDKKTIAEEKSALAEVITSVNEVLKASPQTIGTIKDILKRNQSPTTRAKVRDVLS